MTQLASFSSAAFTTASGLAVGANATVEVRREDTSALAAIFANEDGTGPITNPSAFADSSGRFTFYVAGIARGYSVKVTSGAESFTLRNVAIGTAAQLDATAFAATLLDDADAAAARATLGVVVKRKTADESVTSSTTLQDDDHLTFPIAANEEWIADFYLSTGGYLLLSGLKLAITTPAGATLHANAIVTGRRNTPANPANSAVQSTNTSGTALIFPTAEFGNADAGFVHISVWVLNGGTAGNVTLQFAQSTSHATSIVVNKGSHLIAHRIA